MLILHRGKSAKISGPLILKKMCPALGKGVQGGGEGEKGLGLFAKRRRRHLLLNKRWNLFLHFMCNESGTGRGSKEGGSV
jgi:hypothetical protein